MANTSVASAKYGKVQHYAQITQTLLKQYFPTLSRIPDIVYLCTAMWGTESTFHMSFTNTKFTGENAVLNGVTSMHHDPTASNAGGLIPSYMKSPNVQNILHSGTPQQIINIHQGRVPHGASGCMGCYNVYGTRPYNDIFRNKHYALVIDTLGLTVQPGQSIIGLFPDNDTGLARSIACGLIVLDNKYRIALKKYGPQRAMEYAIDAYVGKGKDQYGYDSKNRYGDVTSKTSSLGVLLANAQIQPNNRNAYNSVITYTDFQTASEADSKQTTVASTDNTPIGTTGCS